MTKYAHFGAIIIMTAISGAALAHGLGGGAIDESDNAPDNSLFESIGKKYYNESSPAPTTKDTLPRMSMIVVEKMIRLTIKNFEGEPMDLEFAEANAFVSSGDDTSVVHLSPVGGNVLAGEGNFVARPGMRVDVTLRLPGRRPINKDFYPLR